LAKLTEENETFVGADRDNRSLTGDDTNTNMNSGPIPPSSAPSRPITSTHGGGGAAGTSNNNNSSNNVIDGSLDPAAAALKKEEDDFLKLESIFISELGIDSNTLPGFVAK
jgi:hypothetical protein